MIVPNASVPPPVGLVSVSVGDRVLKVNVNATGLLVFPAASVARKITVCDPSWLPSVAKFVERLKPMDPSTETADEPPIDLRASRSTTWRDRPRSSGP